MNTLRTNVAVLAISGLMLSACHSPEEWSVQSNGDMSAELGMPVPEFLTENRMLEPDDLELEVSANSNNVVMTQNEQGVWQGQINFDPNETVTIIAAWSAKGNSLLPLASARRTVDIGNDPAGVIVPMEDRRFSTNFDSDGDGRSNIAELRAGFDPRNFDSPGTVAERLPVRIDFGVPASLQDAEASVVNALSLAVSVNGLVFPVTRNGNVWSGESTEIEGNDVFIDAKFYANSARDNLLDRYELRYPMESNGVFLGLDTPSPTP